MDGPCKWKIKDKACKKFKWFHVPFAPLCSFITIHVNIILQRIQTFAFPFTFLSGLPLIPGKAGSATRWSSSRRAWAEEILLKNASASASVVESQTLFQQGLSNRKFNLKLCIADLCCYLKLFHCVWVWQVCFSRVVDNLGLPNVQFVPHLFWKTAPPQREMPCNGTKKWYIMWGNAKKKRVSIQQINMILF